MSIFNWVCRRRKKAEFEVSILKHELLNSVPLYIHIELKDAFLELARQKAELQEILEKSCKQQSV
jgi:hypothetical protein